MGGTIPVRHCATDTAVMRLQRRGVLLKAKAEEETCCGQWWPARHQSYSRRGVGHIPGGLLLAMSAALIVLLVHCTLCYRSRREDQRRLRAVRHMLVRLCLSHTLTCTSDIIYYQAKCGELPWYSNTWVRLRASRGRNAAWRERLKREKEGEKGEKGEGEKRER